MSNLNDVHETKVYLALAAWRSYQRLRREADFWENLVEQRTAEFSQTEREEFFKKRTSYGPATTGTRLGSLAQRTLARR